jgi:hypothetical protein
MSFKTKNNNLEFTTPKFHSYGLYGLTFRTQFYGGSLSLTYNTNDLRGINFDANGDSVDSTRQLFLKNHILKDAKISFDNQIYCYLKDHNIAGVGDNADQRYKNSPSTTANIADNTAPN